MTSLLDAVHTAMNADAAKNSVPKDANQAVIFLEEFAEKERPLWDIFIRELISCCCKLKASASARAASGVLARTFFELHCIFTAEQTEHIAICMLTLLEGCIRGPPDGVDPESYGACVCILAFILQNRRGIYKDLYESSSHSVIIGTSIDAAYGFFLDCELLCA